MSEAQDQILKMVEEGTITAEEADRLLAALGPEQSVETVAGDLVVADLPQLEPAESTAQSPNYNRFRRFWRIPFVIAAGSLLLSGLGLAFMYQADEGVATLGFLCIWSIFLLAFVATILILLARRAPWLHVRVQEKDGSRFAISLPLPMRLASWVLGIARYFVPKEQAMHVDTAASFVTAMQENPGQEPIVIDVDDDDGDKVEIYIG
ncbi:MAG TPA: hypothetical protein VLE70_08420 [Anaerolineae bacterium]|jgi:hypothetical protein|nr:hypothetical protein [Anaerolineae bacterium]